MNKKVKFSDSVRDSEITPPSSKSYTHRALISGAVLRKKLKIYNPLFSDDTLATVRALEQFGIKFDIATDHIMIKQSTGLTKPVAPVNAGESASTLRMLIPLSLMFDDEVIFDGETTLRQRPLQAYIKFFEDYGISYDYCGELPITVKGSLKQTDLAIYGSTSSQYVSGLIYYLTALNQDAKLEILGDIVSKGYIDMTIDVLRRLGKDIRFTGNNIELKKSKLSNTDEFFVESDFSNSAFYIAYGLINHQVSIKGLKPNSVQGDSKIIDFAKSMNGNLQFKDDKLYIYPSQLKAQTIDISDCPDLAPPLAVLGVFAEGKTILTGAGRLRIKETDRIKSIVEELAKLGVAISEQGDEIHIIGKSQLKSAVVSSRNDHRIAMMLSIVASKIKDGIELENSEAVSKSYPEFFEDITKLGAYYE